MTNSYRLCVVLMHRSSLWMKERSCRVACTLPVCFPWVSRDTRRRSSPRRPTRMDRTLWIKRERSTPRVTHFFPNSFSAIHARTARQRASTCAHTRAPWCHGRATKTGATGVSCTRKTRRSTRWKTTTMCNKTPTFASCPRRLNVSSGENRRTSGPVPPSFYFRSMRQEEARTSTLSREPTLTAIATLSYEFFSFFPQQQF